PSSRPALRDGSWRGQSDDRANPCCCCRSLSDRIPESWHHSARISAARWKASDDAATHVRTSIETSVSRMRSYPLDQQLSDRFASIDDASRFRWARSAAGPTVPPQTQSPCSTTARRSTPRHSLAARSRCPFHLSIPRTFSGAASRDKRALVGLSSSRDRAGVPTQAHVCRSDAAVVRRRRPRVASEPVFTLLRRRYPLSLDRDTQTGHMKKILLVSGTRPEIIKLAPVYHALRAASWAHVHWLHTGQHGDMAQQILSCFDIVPDIALGRQGATLSEFSVGCRWQLEAVMTRQ